MKIEEIDNVPICGESDNRNEEYISKYTPIKFFEHFIGKNNPLIIDIGAHKGESVIFFKSIFPDSSIISFEPDEDNFLELKKVSEIHNSKCHNYGVGRLNIKRKFYKQSLSHLGSFLKINNNSLDSLGYSKKALNQTKIIEMISLDEFCKNYNITNIDLIKIDVQGFESEVLCGSNKILKNTKSVMVEISLYDFYDKINMDNFYTVHKFLNEKGFVIWDISKISKNPKNFRTDWIEVVFVNSNIN